MGHCRTCTCPGLRPGAEDPGRQRGRSVSASALGRAFRREDSQLDVQVGLVLRGVDPARGLDAAEVTRNVHGYVGVTRAQVEVVRRRLEVMVSTGIVRRIAEPVMGGTGGSQPTRYGLTIYPEP